MLNSWKGHYTTSDNVRPTDVFVRFEQAVNSLQGIRKFFWLTSFLLVVLILHTYGAYQNLSERNIGARHTGYQKNDQEDYMLYAKALYFTDYQYVGDGNRTPLYPILQSLHYSPTISMEDYFRHGKYFNIGLSIVLLIGLFLIFVHYLPTLAALNLMLVTTFQLYMFRAAYFQAELLYYSLSFGAFVLLLELLRRPSWKIAILAGGVAALAQLTKASFLPGMLSFLGVLGLYAVSLMWQRRHWQGYVGSATLVLAVFLIVLYPYISRVKATFGHYFYNVNTTFYIWYADKAEVEAPTSTKAHGDSVGWPDLPDDQLPSFQKYLHETSPHEFWDRMAFGAKLAFRRHIMPGSYGYSPYIVGYPLIVLIFALLAYFDQNRRAELMRLLRCRWPMVLYGVGYVGGYILLYIFYMRISGGQRFMLALFLPLMFSSALAMNLPIFQSHPTKITSVRSLSLINLSLFFILSTHAFYNVLCIVADFYAGD